MDMQILTTEKWRMTNRPVKLFWGLSPWLMPIWLFALFAAKFLSFWSFIIATCLTLFFWVIERHFEIPALMALRWLRTRLMGSKKQLWPKWIKR